MFCHQCKAFWKEAVSKTEAPDVLQSCEDVHWQYHEKVIHQNVRALKRESDHGCHICRIVYATPTSHERQTLLKDHNEPLSIVLILDPSKGPHPILLAEFREAPSDAVRIPRRIVACCSGLLEDRTSDISIENKKHTDLISGELAATIQLGSEMDQSHTGSDGALHLAAFWLKTCISKHETCQLPSTNASTSFVPTRLVDVSGDSIRLIESNLEIGADSDRRFLALSHCWGPTPIIRTLNENYEAHRKAIAPESLSKTFREAVQVTRKLGFRYIWIDSLCIKQDDAQDWAAEAATMCDVYQHATLTIAAAHASSGDIGCFTQRDGLVHFPFSIDLPHDTESRRILFASYGGSTLNHRSALYSRAWVLQEQLLSPRMLVFDGPYIHWECLEMHGSEGMPTSGLSRLELSHKRVRSGIMDTAEYFNHIGATEDDYKDRYTQSRNKHHYWCRIVMDFTFRGMTKPADRLVAIAGVASALGRRTKSEYLAGLWSEHFAAGLLRGISHIERFPSDIYGPDGFEAENNALKWEKQNLAPSWSWAAVTAPVTFSTSATASASRICEVISASVEGSINKQTGRAEIRGHVRRGYVNPVYPYTVRGAAAKYPQMTMAEATRYPGGQYSTFKRRAFQPYLYFLFSETPPSSSTRTGTGKAKGAGKATSPPEHLASHGPFRFVRGCFEPDELLSPAQEITFLAIAQDHAGGQLHKITTSHRADDALKVHSLALVPSPSGKGEYIRVGLAVWDECAWYGYLCGFKNQNNRFVERVQQRQADGRRRKEHAWERVGRKWWWDDFELYEQVEKGAHEHAFQEDCLPDRAKYRAGIEVEERVVVIV